MQLESIWLVIIFVELVAMRVYPLLSTMCFFSTYCSIYT